MEATKEITLTVETADAAEVQDVSALRELASLELGLVGGGMGAVTFM